ncbi:hypothetical protein BH24ACT15_BH24ACT15_38450 [soil metagenome]
MSAVGELLDTAEALMTRTSADSWGRWPRASALLIRQSIETAIDRLDPALAGVRNARARLMALRAVLSDDQPLADDVDYAYGALSRMIHHHAYELPPTAVELQQMIAIARRLAVR